MALPSLADLRELMALPCKEWMCLELPNKSVKRASPHAQKPLYFFSHVLSEPYILHCLFDVKEQNTGIGWLKYGKQVVKIKQLQANAVPCLQQKMFCTVFTKALNGKVQFRYLSETCM